MKPNLVWCVWYRGRGLVRWTMLDCTPTKSTAKGIVRAESANGLLEWKITRHEVEGPR